MKRVGHGAVLFGCIVFALAIAVAVVPARLAGFSEWRNARQRSAPVRRALHEEFGSRLGRVMVAAPLDPALPEREKAAAGVTFELEGDVSDSDLCAAMIALHRAAEPPTPVLSVTAVRPDDGMAYECLQWDSESGHLRHLVGVGSGCECMLVEYLDGAHHACAFALTPDAEVPLGVDLAVLARCAAGQRIQWQADQGGRR